MTIDYEQLARVVAVANGKGGVLKTSLAANIAGLAAAAGHKTLLVELDKQADLSDDLGYHADERRDDGKSLAAAMLYGQPLVPSLTGVRPNLDVVCGGDYLADVPGALLARQSRGPSDYALLARALAPVAGDYDLVLIDTPPIDETLQLIALSAARWLLAPTKADTSSIRAIQTIAARAAEVRSTEHPLDILGVVLTGVPTSATRVRADAEADITRLLGDVAPLFAGGIRASEAVARETRSRGLLVHELAEQVEGAEPFWRSLRDGTKAQRLPGSAPALAGDYVHVTEQVLLRIAELEEQSRGVA